MGEMHGQGVLTFKNQTRYEGQMMRNMMHGEKGGEGVAIMDRCTADAAFVVCSA